jgi:hypothetical protein
LKTPQPSQPYNNYGGSAQREQPTGLTGSASRNSLGREGSANRFVEDKVVRPNFAKNSQGQPPRNMQNEQVMSSQSRVGGGLNPAASTSALAAGPNIRPGSRANRL